MTVFEWLLVGHLVGDWAFQNEWMVRHKQEGLLNRAVFVHCGVYTVVMLIALVVATRGSETIVQTAWFGLIVYVTHWLIDATNVADTWMHVLQQSNVLFVRIVVDQIFHLLIIALLIEFLL